MHRREKQPNAFAQFAAIGGELEFAIFDDADGSEGEILDSVRQSLPASASFDPALLRALGGREIDLATFYGDALDPAGRDLIRRGEWRTEMGRVLANPRFRELDDERIVSGGCSLPEPGAGGNFARAFASPPYALKARASEVQRLFDAVRTVILPPGTTVQILDWASPRLPAVSDYFAAGMEWWGVCLFSVYVPERRQLTIISGSATD